MPQIEDRYLGDGVYASFDGYYIVLDLRAHNSTTRIALKPEVLAQLNHYVEDLRKGLPDEPFLKPDELGD